MTTLVSRPMTAGRLEWLRITRARGGLVLLIVYAFFGLIAPLTAKYMQKIAGYASTDVTIIAPAPIPAHGIVNFVDQAAQTGLIVAMVVAAMALCFDARPGLAVFYRTRARGPFALLGPRFASSCALVVAAYTVGTLVAWFETWLLIGALPVAAVLEGVALEAVYLVFAVAVVAYASTLGRRTGATVGIAIGILLVALPLLALVPDLGLWVPAKLASAPADLVTGGAATTFLRPVVVTVAATAGLLTLAVRRSARRDL